MPGFMDRTVAGSVRFLPRPVVGRIAARYIAGETMDEALAAVRKLAAVGCRATIDVLGEHVTTREQALRTRHDYERLLERLAAAGLPSGISVKPTAVGLAIDPELALDNLRRLAAAAAGQDRFMRVDMEESAWTASTLDLVESLHREQPRVGAVIQARLRRSGADAARLASRRISVRLCKGIYQEPPAIAYTDFGEIRQRYLKLLDMFLEAGCHVGVATHDRFLAERALEMVRHHGVAPGGFEFQMLMGVAEPLRARLVAAGHRVRVYVPYGTDWLGYSMRRLQENPRLATQVAAGLLGPLPLRRG